MISLDISGCGGFGIHRSGWKYCISSLLPFHSKHGYADRDWETILIGKNILS